MISSSQAARRNLVLVGGGHSHVEVLRHFARRPAPDIHLTLVSRDIETPYSGMLPGLVAGHYTHEEAHIDLRPLAQSAGADLYHSEAIGLDLAARRLGCIGRPAVEFDVVSLDIGSHPDWQGVPGAAEHTLPIKPVDGFLAGWQAIEQRLRRHDGVFRIVVVGGGAGGTEISLALQHRLATRMPALRAAFAIVTNTSELLPTHHPGVRRRLTRVVRKREIAVHFDRTVVRVESGTLQCRPDETIAFDAAIWVTDAAPAPWLRAAGLATDERGFVAVDKTLRSISHPFVFAAGDVAAVADYHLAKSGVFAVREGPPLARNLRRACRGGALEAYRPQRHHLALISTGDRCAVASRGGWNAEGRLLWRLKDLIDRRWMRKYQRRTPMTS